MFSRDKYFPRGSVPRIWQKHCGFLDLSVAEFMEIQEHLLLEEIEIIAQSSLGRRIMGGANPKTVEEFRRLVPLTIYENYAPYIGNCQEDALLRIMRRA